jgi:hypothetical protein
MAATLAAAGAPVVVEVRLTPQAAPAHLDKATTAAQAHTVGLTAVVAAVAQVQ